MTGAPVSAPPARERKPEDSAAGCRSLAREDQARARAADSQHMRFRLACSAEAWNVRADMLDRIEAQRARSGGQA
jgi:hypothetical protein